MKKDCSTCAVLETGRTCHPEQGAGIDPDWQCEYWKPKKKGRNTTGSEPPQRQGSKHEDTK